MICEKLSFVNFFFLKKKILNQKITFPVFYYHSTNIQQTIYLDSKFWIQSNRNNFSLYDKMVPKIGKLS